MSISDMDVYLQNTAINEMNEHLAHYGVKGMKWGVRKDASRADKKWAKNIYSLPGAIAIHNEAARTLNGPNGVSKINDLPKYKGKDLTSDPVLHDAYNRDVMKQVGIHTKIAVDKIHGTSPSGSYKADLIVDARGTPVKVVVDEVDIKHDSSQVSIEYEVIADGMFIKHFLPVKEDELTQTSINEMNEHLAHYGVKGMKWGVRKDGSVSSETQKNSHLRRKATDVTVKQKPGKFATAAGGKRQTANRDAVVALAARQQAKRSTTDSLSNAQLKEAVKRMQMEQQFHELMKKSDRRGRGKKMVQKILGNKKNQQMVVKGTNKTVRVVKTAMDAAKPPGIP